MSNSTNGWAIMFANVGTCKRHSKLSVPGWIQLLIAFSICQLAGGLSEDQFYPFNVNETGGDSRTDIKDDGGSPAIKLDVDFPFFSTSEYRLLYVNNNGIISFLKELKTYTPVNFNDTAFDKKIPIVAPYWSDVDIENVRPDGAPAPVVVYRVTNDSSVMDRAARDINGHFGSYEEFTPKVAVIVTWYKVGFYGATESGKLKRNTFQAVLMTDGTQSYAIFNYNSTVWTTGSNSGGSTETGLDGDPAVVGFHSGNESYYLQDVSGTAAVVNLSSTSNVGVPGKYIYRIDGQVDDLHCSVVETVTVEPQTVSMLGREAVTITGPCLNLKSSNITAKINDTVPKTFSCDVVSHVAAVCVVPSLFRTGQLTLELIIDGKQFVTTINSVHVMQVPALLSRDTPESWQPGSIVRVRWEENAATTDLHKELQVVYFKMIDSVPQFVVEKTVNVTADSSPSTSRRFRLPTEFSQNKSLVIRLCSHNELHPYSLPVCIWSDIFPVRWSSQNSKESEQWCKTWLREEKLQPTISVKPPLCPCIVSIVESDFGQFQKDPICDISKQTSKLNCVYNPGAKQCFSRIMKSAHGHGLTCCYDAGGELMDVRDVPGAGTHQRYHYQSQGDHTVPYFSYFESDLLPRLHCCQLSHTNCTQLALYRKPTTCAGYSAPSAAQAAGDPHLVTLDGKNYTFNGVGDFYLVRDVDSGLVVQVRAVQTVDQEGRVQNATVFSHVAVALLDRSDTIQIGKSPENGSPEILVNRRPVTASTSQFKDISLIQQDNSTYRIVVEPISVSLDVRVTPNLVNIIVMVGEDTLKGKLRGLLGNYNSNPDDDFIARNGTTLHASLTMRSVHEDFGMTWSVPESDCILSSPFPSSESVLAYTPVFLDEQDDAMPNDTEVVCGGNLQCRFDYMVTGDKALAKETAEFVNKFEVLRDTLNQKVIRCPFLDAPENGNKSVSGYANGSIATFTCNAGFEMIRGTSRRVCREDSSWSGSGVVCAIKVVPPEDSGVKLVLIVVISCSSALALILVSLLIYCIRRRRQRHKQEGSNSIELQDIPRYHNTVFDNPDFIHSLQGLARDGRFRIPRPNFVDPSIYQEYF